MISINFNITGLTNITKKIKSLYGGEEKDKLLRTLATSTLPIIRNRIHVEGKKPDGSQIGVYTNPYLKRRQKEFKRTSDPKKVYSLTRQLENDLSVVPGSNGGYAIGVKNKDNADKVKWLEAQDGVVYAASNEEKQYARDIADDFTENLFDAAP